MRFRPGSMTLRSIENDSRWTMLKGGSRIGKLGGITTRNKGLIMIIFLHRGTALGLIGLRPV